MYEARSVIASAQRCVNLYPEKNAASEAPFPMTNQLTPGLIQLIPGTGSTHRCSYTSSVGQLYEVIGENVYATSSDWTRSFLGAIGDGTTPVVMSDNGLVILIVDGTPNGYCIDMSNNAFATVSGQAGAFYGGTRVDCIDTFFLLNRPGTNQWYISLSNVTFDNLTGTVTPDTTAAAFDPLDIAAKVGNPDPLSGVIAMHREAWLIGTETSEVWYDAGDAQFSFTELPGVFIEHGCVAAYSIAKQDLSIYWLSKDRQGQAIVLTGNQYAARRVSTHSIENKISSYSTISDAIGFTYQQLGHTFYVLTFPTANATWVYDIAEDLWHERTWTDSEGGENRIRANDCTPVYDVIVVGDHETGALYQWDLNTFTDNGQPIVRRRGWPDIQVNNRRVEFSRLILDMDVGEIENTLSSDELQISLRYSNDRGKTWGNPRVYGLGSTGQFERSILFSQLGQARNRVFEVFWSVPTFTALNGGSVWAQPSET
jgi:hypothetical protein